MDLAGDELITAVRFAPVRAAAYAKLYQRASRFAIVGVAAALDVAGGVVRGARLGSPRPSRRGCPDRVETAFAGRPADADSGRRGRRARRRRLSDINARQSTPAPTPRAWGGCSRNAARAALSRG